MKIFQILLLAGAVALGFVLPDLLKSSADLPQLDEEKYCTLSTRECVQDSVIVRLEHDYVKPLKPSRIEVRWDNAASETLMLSLQGLEMDMGTAKYQLIREANGIFSATLLLPVCTQDKMTWIGSITDGQKEIFPAIRMER